MSSVSGGTGHFNRSFEILTDPVSGSVGLLLASPHSCIASIPRSACLRPHLSEITDRINQRLEDVKQSVRAGELPRNSDNLQCFHSPFIGASNSFAASCVRRSSLEETEIIYRKSARGRQALLGRCANFICGSCLSNFRAESRRQRMNRHRTIHILRAVWHHWIRAGRTKICEKGLQENRKGTTPRRQARTT